MSVSSEVQPVTDRTVFEPIHPDYADLTVPVTKSFDWQGILGTLRVPLDESVSLYAFRSERLAEPLLDAEALACYDETALLAAKKVEGFIHYQAISGLSYCIWRNPEAARIATDTPEHRAAASIVNLVYREWQLLNWNVHRSAGRDGVAFDLVSVRQGPQG